MGFRRFHAFLSVLSVVPGVACGGMSVRNVEQTQALERVARYRVIFDGTAEEAAVEVCFEGSPPALLRRVGAGAERLIQDARDDRGVLRVQDRTISLVGVTTGSCIHYDVALTDGGPMREAMQRSGGEALVTLGLFLWAPVDGTPMTMRFEADGRHVSVPWEGEEVPTDVLRLASNVAVTRNAPRRFEHRGLEIEVAQMEGPLAIDEAAVERWLRSAVDAVRPVGGSFPQERLHFVVVPAGAADSPIAFGLVRRGGGASVLLFPTSGASEDALKRDWVLVHELSHLTMPRLRGDRWISEGYATYMQEQLRMGSGLLTPEEGWRRISTKLVDERAGAGLPLAEESEGMMATRTFAHVYWSGAALFLELDIALRKRGTSLAGLVAQAPWLEGERWDGLRCLAALDRLAGADIAIPLAERYAQMTEIPDLSPLLAELGVFYEDGTVRFDDAAEHADIRRAMSVQSGENEPLAESSPVQTSRRAAEE